MNMKLVGIEKNHVLKVNSVLLQLFSITSNISGSIRTKIGKKTYFQLGVRSYYFKRNQMKYDNELERLCLGCMMT